MKILLVGAGAVGQVFGYHLQTGGAEVSFYVKEKHAEECRRGYALYALNRSRKARAKPLRFQGFGVLTTIEEVAARKWDQVYFCMSSTGLRGPWLGELARATGDATVVALQPGIDDRHYILESVDESRLVSGMISLVSYHAPLAGESYPEPGMAYWFPPFSPSPFSGPEARVSAVVEALQAGGQPAVRHKDVPAEVAFPSAALFVLILALESANWSLAELRQGDRLGLATRALGEIYAIIAARLGIRPPAAAALLKAPLLRCLIGLAPSFVPFPLETYLHVHFTKVGDQTRFAIRSYLAEGRKAAQSVAAVEALVKLVPA